MGLIKALSYAALIGVMLTPTLAPAEEKFNDFATSAMKVYTKFERPSIQESESFFTYIKSEWSKSNCSTTCSDAGYEAGVEYARLMKVQLKNELQ